MGTTVEDNFFSASISTMVYSDNGKSAMVKKFVHSDWLVIGIPPIIINQ